MADFYLRGKHGDDKKKHLSSLWMKVVSNAENYGHGSQCQVLDASHLRWVAWGSPQCGDLGETTVKSPLGTGVITAAEPTPD